MYDIIKRIILFLMPILKTAAIETAADITYEAAYGRRPVKPFRPTRRNGYLRYDRLERPRTYGTQNHSHLGFRDRDKDGKFGVAESFSPWNGVVKIMFDLSATNEAFALQWLTEQMPDVGAVDYKGKKVALEAWTVEEDN